MCGEGKKIQKNSKRIILSEIVKQKRGKITFGYGYTHNKNVSYAKSF